MEYIARGLTESTDKAVRMEALGTLNVEACKIPLRDFIKQETDKDKDLLRQAKDVYGGLLRPAFGRFFPASTPSNFRSRRYGARNKIAPMEGVSQ